MKTKQDAWFWLSWVVVIFAFVVSLCVAVTKREIIFHELLNTISSFLSNLVYESYIMVYSEGIPFFNLLLVFLSLLFFIMSILTLLKNLWEGIVKGSEWTTRRYKQIKDVFVKYQKHYAQKKFK